MSPFSLRSYLVVNNIALAFLTIGRLADVPSVSAFSFPTIASRRSAITQIVSTSSALVVGTHNKQPALAKPPFAPVDALLPATRVKLTIDNAVSIATNLATETNAEHKQLMLHNLETLLLTPQNYNRGTTPMKIPPRPAQSYLQAYTEYRNTISPLEKPGAMLVQRGEIDAWKRLKREEATRESADEVRAALNYYTSNLNYDAERFVLTATKEERSKLIREDRIPDVKTVIASDLGVRYLLRNEVLTVWDDAKAELRYLMRQSLEDVDGRELLELLVKAQNECQKWFDLIDKKDTLAAMDIVRNEN
ncbi:hypothetical protein HJC23_005964 [Cyclotella cryptica]|uniref:Uncharacterized protein n=1 Tax=Cyclotella cryptica TaxID=29204 RepID=A0ABD3QZD2_9STRA|eukprot:CCRYP_000520-RA/>CCRYP_000520-RA protein AED:0.43 eAED:0.43 QI:0/-1/0/1/-1/1/1/0/305